jgi:hypothetical protein
MTKTPPHVIAIPRTREKQSLQTQPTLSLCENRGTRDCFVLHPRTSDVDPRNDETSDDENALPVIARSPALAGDEAIPKDSANP